MPRVNSLLLGASLIAGGLVLVVAGALTAPILAAIDNVSWLGLGGFLRGAAIIGGFGAFTAGIAIVLLRAERVIGRRPTHVTLTLNSIGVLGALVVKWGLGLAAAGALLEPVIVADLATIRRVPLDNVGVQLVSVLGVLGVATGVLLWWRDADRDSSGWPERL